jgi:ribosomal protein L34E
MTGPRCGICGRPSDKPHDQRLHELFEAARQSVSVESPYGGRRLLERQIEKARDNAARRKERG